MKQKTFALITLLALTSVASPASALELEAGVKASTTRDNARVEMKQKFDDRKASTSERRMEAKAEMEVRVASSSERREERKASSTARRVEMQQGIAKKRAEHAAKVMLATIGRLEKILIRVESRIVKVKAEGGNTAESEAASAQTRVQLNAARAAIESFVSIDLSSNKASENFERIREVGSIVKGHIKEAHQSLKDAVKALKPGQRNNNATSTSATTTTNTNVSATTTSTSTAVAATTTATTTAQ